MMAVDFLKNPNNTGPPPPLILKYSDDEMAEILTSAKLTVFLQLHGRKMGCFQLGSSLHGFFKLHGRVQVCEHGYCRGGNWMDWIKLGRIKTTTSQDPTRPKFTWVKMGQLIDSERCLDLPLHVQIAGGPLVGLAYSRAQHCYHCGGFGHFRKTCPELNQRMRSPNRATPSNSGPTQVHRPHLDRKPVPVSDFPPPTSFPEETLGGVKVDGSILQMSSEESHEGTTSSEDSEDVTTSSEESHEGTSEITPFSPKEFFARCSGSTSPARPIEETEMGAKGAMLVESGGESRPKLYNIGEEVCEIDVAVKVTHLNDQRGNQHRVTITPCAGDAPRCLKKLLYTTIEDAEDRNVIRALKDTCHENDISMAIVFDKSSVLINDDQIVRCFGFSASHNAEMTFRSFGSDGYARDVKGNYLLMWNGEELRVNVSPV